MLSLDKVRILWEVKWFDKIPHILTVKTNWEIFIKCLWSSQNIWTLKFFVCKRIWDYILKVKQGMDLKRKILHSTVPLCTNAFMLYQYYFLCLGHPVLIIKWNFNTVCVYGQLVLSNSLALVKVNRLEFRFIESLHNC